MPVTDVTSNLDEATLTMTAEFAAPVERVWQVYADPRELERVWGPPTHPATVVEHELVPGGRVTYFMQGPDGERYHGWWQVTDVEAPHRLEFADGFGDENFAPVEGMPVSHNVYRFEEVDGGTRAVYLATYESRAGLEQVLGMGVIEGATAAINQLDALVAS